MLVCKLANKTNHAISQPEAMLLRACWEEILVIHPIVSLPDMPRVTLVLSLGSLLPSIFLFSQTELHCYPVSNNLGSAILLHAQDSEIIA